MAIFTRGYLAFKSGQIVTLESNAKQRDNALGSVRLSFGVKDHYQSKELVCVSVIRHLMHITLQMHVNLSFTYKG